MVWDTLVSDVKIAHDFTGLGFEGKSELWLTGTVRGNVTNDELLTLRHKCGPGSGLNACIEDRRSRIAEFGGDFLLGAGRVLPFVAFDHSTLRSNGSTEQGATGLELVLQPARSAQSFAGTGVRYAHDWETGGTGWRFNLDARYQHRISSDDAQYAAFVGTPGPTFDLADWSRPGSSGVVNPGLAGTMGRYWSCAFEYTHQFGIDAPAGGWFVGLRREL